MKYALNIYFLVPYGFLNKLKKKKNQPALLAIIREISLFHKSPLWVCCASHVVLVL